jgi:ribosome-associated translation inhibitor RaiA
MTIQINTDKNLTVHESYSAKIHGLLSEELSRYSENITRLEVHLSDENGNKDGINDMRCMIEARLEGRQPIAVKEAANTVDQAINGAIEKLKSVLTSLLEKLSNH